MTKVIRWDSPSAIRMGLNTFDIDAEMYQNQMEQQVNGKIRGFFFLYGFLNCTESKVPEIKKNDFVCRFHVISFAGSDLIRDSKLEKRWHSFFFLKISLTFNK